MTNLYLVEYKLDITVCGEKRKAAYHEGFTSLKKAKEFITEHFGKIVETNNNEEYKSLANKLIHITTDKGEVLHINKQTLNPTHR